MSKVECMDCDSPDYSELLKNRGNGNCSSCHGEGKITNIGHRILYDITRGNVDDSDECEACNGTGRCQTCNGGGYTDENDDLQNHIDDDEIDDKSSQYSTYSEDTSYYTNDESSGYSKQSDSTEPENSLAVYILALALLIGFIVFYEYYIEDPEKSKFESRRNSIEYKRLEENSINDDGGTYENKEAGKKEANYHIPEAKSEDNRSGSNDTNPSTTFGKSDKGPKHYEPKGAQYYKPEEQHFNSNNSYVINSNSTIDSNGPNFITRLPKNSIDPNRPDLSDKKSIILISNQTGNITLYESADYSISHTGNITVNPGLEVTFLPNSKITGTITFQSNSRVVNMGKITGTITFQSNSRVVNTGKITGTIININSIFINNGEFIGTEIKY